MRDLQIEFIRGAGRLNGWLEWQRIQQRRPDGRDRQRGPCSASSRRPAALFRGLGSRRMLCIIIITGSACHLMPSVENSIVKRHKITEL